MDEVKVNWLIVITPGVNKNPVDAIVKTKKLYQEAQEQLLHNFEII